MAQDIERLVLQIEANTKQLERSMRKVEKSVGDTMKKSSKYANRFNASLAATQRQMVSFAKIAAGGLAIGSLTQLPGVISDLVGQTADIGKVADKVGLTTQSLQELRFAAQLAGIASTQLDTGMQRFARRLAEAANGSGELLAILKANNVALRNADGSMRSQNELLDDYADLIKNAGSEQEQLLLAFKAFDTEGAAMVNVLRGGSAGLREFRQEAHDTGGVISEELIREMEELDDRFQRLSRTIGINLKGAILGTISELNYIIDGVRDFEDQTVGSLERRLEQARVTASNNQGLPWGEGALRDIDAIQAELAKRIEQEKALNQILDDRGNGQGGGSDSGSGTGNTRIPYTGSAQVAAHDRVIESLKRQAAALSMTSEEQRLYNALAQAGVGINSVAGQEIEGIVAATNRVIAAQQKYNDAMTLAESSGMALFDSLMDGAKDFGDALEGLGEQFLRMAAQSALFGTGGMSNLMGTSTASGGSGGIIGNLVSGLIGTLPKYHSGGIAGLKPDEVPAVLQKGERIIPNGLPSAPSMPSLGNSDLHITLGVAVDESESLRPFVESVSGDVAVSVVQGAAPTLVEKSVQASGSALGGGSFDKAMGRYGGKPRAKVR